MTDQADIVRTDPTDVGPGIEPEVASVRERYGKADLVASILGMFAALGTLVFLTRAVCRRRRQRRAADQPAEPGWDPG